MNSGFLNPAGPVAIAQRDLLFWVVGLSMVVVLPVLVLTPWLLWRYRHNQPQHPHRRQAAYRPRWEFSLPLEILSWGVPVLIVVLLAALTWQRTWQLDPYRPLPDTSPVLEIQVIALDWKWVFIYPEQGVASVNELVIPSGRAVHLNLTSATVMQSLMIPQLAGQIYAMAGMRTQLYLKADATGEFTGRNTQFNGAGFQAQSFTARAMPSQAFEDWLATARQSAAELDCATYLQLSTSPTLPPAQLYRAVQRGLFDWVIHSFHAGTRHTCNATETGDAHE